MPIKQAIRHEKDKISTYLGKAISSKLILPNFQRSFVWDKKAQLKLLSSILAGIPMGSILLLEGEPDDYSSRLLAYEYETKPEGTCEYLLDGQQRLSVIRAIFCDLYSQEIWESLLGGGETYDWVKLHQNVVSNNLNIRWFLKLDPSVDSDPFGYKDLKFPHDSLFEPSEYEDLIHFEDVHRTKDNQWFSPGWKKMKDGERLTGHKLKLEVRNKSVSLRLIPLWEVYQHPDSGLHVDVIEEIADKREEEIIADWRDEKISKDYFVNLVSEIDPNIEKYIDEGNDSKIQKAMKKLSQRWQKHIIKFIEERLSQDLPFIFLPKNELHRGIAIFETINRGGTPLSIYDLLVAKYARLGETQSLTGIVKLSLEEKVEVSDTLFCTNKGSKPESWSAESMAVLKDGQPTLRAQKQIINILGVLSFIQEYKLDELKVVHIKKDWALNLTEDDIRKSLNIAIVSFSRALQFIQFRLGITSIDDLQYQLMLLPIAICLSEDSVWNSIENINKVEYWYWASLFSGAYRERQNENCINDVKNLRNWVVKTEGSPFDSRAKLIFSIEGYSDQSAFLRENSESIVSSNVEAGVKQYILSRQPRDILDDTTRLSAWVVSAGGLKIQDHHLIPLATATNIGQSSKELRVKGGHILNSACNRSFILDNTNQKIGSKMINQYWKALSEIALYDHIIPKPVSTEFTKKTDEDDGAYYKRALLKRFELLKDTVREELDLLVSNV